MAQAENMRLLLQLETLVKENEKFASEVFLLLMINDWFVAPSGTIVMMFDVSAYIA